MTNRSCVCTKRKEKTILENLNGQLNATNIEYMLLCPVSELHVVKIFYQ